MLSHLLFLFLGENLKEWRLGSGQILMPSDKGRNSQTMGVTCLKIPQCVKVRLDLNPAWSASSLFIPPQYAASKIMLKYI